MSKTYNTKLTGAQLRILHEMTALILNDPTFPMGQGDRALLARADEQLVERWREACQAESTRAVHIEA